MKTDLHQFEKKETLHQLGDQISLYRTQSAKSRDREVVEDHDSDCVIVEQKQNDKILFPSSFVGTLAIQGKATKTLLVQTKPQQTEQTTKKNLKMKTAYHAIGNHEDRRNYNERRDYKDRREERDDHVERHYHDRRDERNYSSRRDERDDRVERLLQASDGHFTKVRGEVGNGCRVSFDEVPSTRKPGKLEARNVRVLSTHSDYEAKKTWGAQMRNLIDRRDDEAEETSSSCSSSRSTY